MPALLAKQFVINILSVWLFGSGQQGNEHAASIYSSISIQSHCLVLAFLAPLNKLVPVPWVSWHQFIHKDPSSELLWLTFGFWNPKWQFVEPQFPHLAQGNISVEWDHHFFSFQHCFQDEGVCHGVALLCLSVAVIRHWLKATWRRKKFNLAHRLRSITKEAKAGTEAELTEEFCWLVCSTWVAQSSFFYR